jgi:hypothetical protein
LKKRKRSARRKRVEDMTGKKTQAVGNTWKGFVPDTDPRYKSGWNYLSGKNLSQPSDTKSQEATEKPPK